MENRQKPRGHPNRGSRVSSTNSKKKIEILVNQNYYGNLLELRLGSDIFKLNFLCFRILNLICVIKNPFQIKSRKTKLTSTK